MEKLSPFVALFAVTPVLTVSAPVESTWLGICYGETFES
jgi:hypothetical protein